MSHVSKWRVAWAGVRLERLTNFSVRKYETQEYASHSFHQLWSTSYLKTTQHIHNKKYCDERRNSVWKMSTKEQGFYSLRVDCRLNKSNPGGKPSSLLLWEFYIFFFNSYYFIFIILYLLILIFPLVLYLSEYNAKNHFDKLHNPAEQYFLVVISIKLLIKWVLV